MKKNVIIELIKRGEEIKIKEHHFDVLNDVVDTFEYCDGPLTKKWFNDIKILNERELKEHPLYDEINTLLQKNDYYVEEMLQILKSIRDDKVFWRVSTKVKKFIIGLFKIFEAIINVFKKKKS